MSGIKRLVVLLMGLWLLAVFGSSAQSAQQRPGGKSAPALPAALAGYQVSASFVPLSGKPTGFVQKISGSAVAVHTKTKQAYFAAKGDEAYLQDAFYTLKDSRLVLKFTSQDLVALGPDTHLVIKQYLDDPLTREKKSTTQLLKGKALYYVLPLLKYKKTSATVETPNALAGVRGTLFGVEVIPDHAGKAAGKSQLVADASGRIPRLLAQNSGAGRGAFTRFFCFHGSLRITNRITGGVFNLPPMGMLTIGPGGGVRHGQIPPGIINQWLGRGTGQRGGGAGGGGGGAGGGLLHELLAGNTVQQLTTLNLLNQSPTPTPPAPTPTPPVPPTPPAPTPTPPAPTPTPPAPTPVSNLSGIGYFTGMLVDGSNMKALFASTSQQSFSVGETVAMGSALYAAAGFGYLTRVVIGADETNLDSPDYDLSIVQLGSSSHMRWGYWDSYTKTVSTGLGDYDFLRGYWVEGDLAGSLPSPGLYRFSGSAGGIMANSASLAGQVYAAFNFSTNAVDDFYLSVSDGGNNSVYLDSGTGTISGNGFSITAWANGKIVVSGITKSLNFLSLNGAFYGPGAAEAGGVWSAKNSVDPAFAAAGYLEMNTGGEVSAKLSGQGYFTRIVVDSLGNLAAATASIAPQDFDSGETEAKGLNDPSQRLVASQGFSYLASARMINGTTLGPARYYITTESFGVEEESGSTILDWGKWWTGATAFSDVGVDYEMVTYGHYITGVPSASLPGTGLFNYSGQAYGSYSDGALLSGAVSCKIDFDAGSISDFALNVTNGEAGADLRQVTFAGGSGAIAGDKTYSLTATTVTLRQGPDTYNALSHSIKGTFYGTGHFAGGVWQAINDDPVVGASGIFKMDKGSEISGSLSGSGFFSMLVANPDGDAAAIYSSISAQDFGAGTVNADLLGSAGAMVASQNFQNLDSALIVTNVALGSPNYDITIVKDGTVDESGSEILSWGTWASVTKTIDDSGTTYTMNDQGYFVNGNLTASMPGTGIYNYSGVAKGSFIDNTVMTGAASCTVDFSAASISSFHLSVTNGGIAGAERSVTILDAMGTIDGNQWSVNPVGLEGEINRGGTPKNIDDARIKGGFYGTGAHMAGAWTVKSNGDPQYAAGGYLKMSP